MRGLLLSSFAGQAKYLGVSVRKLHAFFVSDAHEVLGLPVRSMMIDADTITA